MLSKSTLKRIYTLFYQPDWGWHLFLVATIVGTLLIYTWLPLGIGQLTDLAVEQASLNALTSQALWVLLAFLGLAGLKMLQQTLLDYALMVRILNRLQPMLLNHLLHCPLAYFEDHSPGDLRNVVVNMSTTAVNSITGLVLPLFTLVQGLYLMVIMFTINIMLTIIVLITLVLYTLIVYVLRQRVQVELEGRNKAERVMSATIDDLYRGFLEIKRNALEETVQNHWYNNTTAYFNATKGFFRYLNTLGFISDFMGNLLPVVLLIAITIPSIVGEVSPATFVTIYTLSIFLTSAIKSVHSLNRAALLSLTNWQHVFDILDTPLEKTGSLLPTNYDIAWSQVSKTLRDKTILKDVNITIKAGEKIMIVGRSGEGKSTILKMLPGLSEANSGAVQIGGILANQLDFTQLRPRIGFVTQAPYLFETSLRENLTYGRSVTDTELKMILQLVQLQSFVDNLPNGLDTHLGPAGYTVSGGEKARIALARAILRHPDILILDEATANLDSQTEEKSSPIY